MKRLDRYVLKELLVPLMIGTIVFALLFVANDMIGIYKTFNVEAIPPLAIAQLLIFKFPQWLSFTLPIGTALGASLAVSRLARESELTAMRAAGISVWRTFRSVLFAGAMMSVLNFGVVDWMVPPASKALRKLSNDVGFVASIPQFKSNVMMSINQYTARFGTIQRGKDGLVKLTDILLFEEPHPGEITLYRSPSGTFLDGIWKIKSATIIHLKDVPKGSDPSKGKDTIVDAINTEDEIAINNPIRVADLFMPPSPEEKSSSELMHDIKVTRMSGNTSAPLEIAYSQKFSGPLACLIFAFTGAILAFRFSKAGPFMGVMVSLGLVWLYFNVYIISTEVFGGKGWLSPVAAAWLPNVLFGVVGLIFVRKLE